jgi:Uma2 family endonuclease
MKTDLLDANLATENPPVQAPKLKPRYSVDEYLALERAADERHYFLDGEIFAMAGESHTHNIICVNTVLTLGNQLIDSDCQVNTKDIKVRSGPVPESGHSTKGFYSYPVVLVICGEPEFHDAYRDVVLNPKVIVEVVSDSTEAFDRGEKFQRYQTYLPNLRDYILISQHRPQIEHFCRQPDGSWSYHSYVGLETTFAIESIGCDVLLADIYRRVIFTGSSSDGE